MSTPSILSAIQKLRLLLSREEKLKWFGIVAFALGSSLLEVFTASIIIMFAQVLNQPELGQKYLIKLGFSTDLSPFRVVSYVSIVVGLIYLIKNILAAIEAFYQNFAIQKMNCHFKNKLLYRYAEIDYGFYLTRNSSFYTQILSGDVELIFSSGITSLAIILSEGIIFIGLIGLVIALNPSLAFVIFGIGGIVGFAIIKGALPRFYRLGQKFQEALLYSSQNLTQFFHGFKEIVLLGKREPFINAYQYYSLKKSHTQATQSAFNSLPRMVIEVLFVGLFVTTISMLCLERESPLHMIGILSGYLYVGFRLMPGLNRIINQLNLFKSIMPAIERVYVECDTIVSKESYVDIPEFTFEEGINLKEISFQYVNANKDSLSDVSLKIKKGECIGIIGETGSGKSTLVDIMLGLLKPYKGGILIDEKFLNNSYQWHQKIGYVPQSVYLIDSTIEANIAFGEQNVDAIRLNKAIDASQLRQFIEQLSEGVKTIVGERGIRLSGGERQRIAIARALYRNPEVLIFDEATAALDNQTEAKLMETINDISKNRTVIMIAHRLTTLKNCDRIIELSAGVIKKITDYASIEKTLFVSSG